MPAVVEKLRTKARADHRARIPMNKLDAAHREVLIRAINNVLATENAVFTYAQIIDGLPIGDVAYDRRNPNLYGDDHPLDSGHEELCPGVLDKAREVVPKWDPVMLAFDPKVINAFQRASPGTKMFNTRLIEMVAVSLHQLAVILHQLGFRMHRPESDIEYVTNWTMSKPDYEDEYWEPIKPYPTVFTHPYYSDWEVYPEGVVDMIGYWVEDRIFGGVVLFDRRAELDEDGNLTGEPTNIYLQPARAKVTCRVTQLLDHQQKALVDFLLATKSETGVNQEDASPVPCPLPIIVDDRNRTRVSPEDALVVRGIYRDIWERTPLTTEEWRIQKRRPQDWIDYPEIAAQGLVLNTRNADVPLPDNRLKRYLEGKEEVPDGPIKRMFDEYKELVGYDQDAERNVRQRTESNVELEAAEEGSAKQQEGESEQGSEVKGGEAEDGTAQRETEKAHVVKVDTLESLQDFLSAGRGGSPSPAS
ncbi:hypothetical protein QBC34DRAFT_297434 [Podospora aff. communis PSN243]|uniref:Portal protein n=1 Tax=Podospora aff. communis PSN243 TaxID=3040156 RepID=A0AAV9GN78_9PEZI|nr:hypothetical protein QBC34DRAFT_297434 [Podospora aff. communis PSN243]